MSRWRILVVLALMGVPVLVWAALGSWYLWTTGWAFVAWWPLMGCVALGYVLAWYWQAKKQLLQPPEVEAPGHWTPRDQEAGKLVEKRAKDGAALPPAQLGEPAFYFETAKQMAEALARFHAPSASDPLRTLPVPEG